MGAAVVTEAVAAVGGALAPGISGESSFEPIRIADFLRFAAGGELEEARSTACAGVAGLRCPAAIGAAFSEVVVSIAVTAEADTKPATGVGAELVCTVVSDCDSRTSSPGVTYPSSVGVGGREGVLGALISTEASGWSTGGASTTTVSASAEGGEPVVFRLEFEAARANVDRSSGTGAYSSVFGFTKCVASPGRVIVDRSTAVGES